MKSEPMVILLVEDDEAHAEIVRRNFETYHMANHLIHVSDGQAALDYLYQRNGFSDPATSPRPGLVLLDLRLPKVNGHEVLKIIKDDAGLKRIPVVILTTSKAEEDMAKAYDNQANSYLVKPVEFGQFAELMKNLACYWLTWNRYPHGV